MTGLIVSGTVRIQPGCCMLGRRAEQCFVTRSPQRTRLLQFIPPLQPDRKARQSKNIRWNFIMLWQYIWLVWHWLNHLPFIFPWLCKSSKSRFSRLDFCRSQKKGASMWAQRSRNVAQCPWPVIVIVPSQDGIVSVVTPCWFTVFVCTLYRLSREHWSQWHCWVSHHNMRGVHCSTSFHHLLPFSFIQSVIVQNSEAERSTASIYEIQLDLVKSWPEWAALSETRTWPNCHLPANGDL